MQTSEKRVFYKTALALVLPMALQNLINVGIQSSDVIMLGRVSQTALSGVSLAGQVQFVLMLFLFGLSSGASVLTAQYWGKGDLRAIEKILSIALRIAFLAALSFALAAVLAPEFLMRIFSPDAAVIAQGVRYLRLVAPGYLIIAFTNVYLNVMRSLERVVVSTVVYAISFVSNIVLNAIFIFGLLGAPALGAAGAALATTLSRIIELVIVAVYAARNRQLRLRLQDYISMHTPLLKDFIRYAGPTTLNELGWGMAIAANAVIIGHMGEPAVAANSVAQVVRQLSTVVSFGLANATAVMVGKAIGAGSNQRARQYASLLFRLTMISGLAGAALILAIRPLVVAAMALSPLAAEYLLFLLFFLALYVLGQAFNGFMVVGVFRGGGDTRFGLILDVSVMWFLTIPLGALAAFVFKWPVPVVYVILMADEFVKMPIAYGRYRSQKWLHNITRPAAEVDADP